MPRCENKVSQWVESGWSYVERKISCGSTGVHGTMVLCENCIEEATKQYPQGWREVPGDICKHGTYVGDVNGSDYLCGQCEDER